VGEALRQRVREETGVTCSVGIAPNRTLAKVSQPVCCDHFLNRLNLISPCGISGLL
jgi:nucleotidyltransferase/DNA polymerase involved in DNA repair